MKNPYLGVGLVFPIQLVNGGAVTESGTELLESSMKMILGVQQSETFMLEKFGSVTENLLDDPNSSVLEGLLDFFIYKPIRDWEPRVTVTKTESNRPASDPSTLYVTIYYRVNSSGLESSFVYPYYLTKTF